MSWWTRTAVEPLGLVAAGSGVVSEDLVAGDGDGAAVGEQDGGGGGEGLAAPQAGLGRVGQGAAAFFQAFEFADPFEDLAAEDAEDAVGDVSDAAEGVAVPDGVEALDALKDTGGDAGALAYEEYEPRRLGELVRSVAHVANLLPLGRPRAGVDVRTEVAEVRVQQLLRPHLFVDGLGDPVGGLADGVLPRPHLALMRLRRRVGQSLRCARSQPNYPERRSPRVWPAHQGPAQGPSIG